MDCGVLGQLCVGDAGTLRTPRGQRSRDLLAVLLLRRGQSVDAGVLLDLVWGESVGLATAVVHTQVARLRRDIGSEHVLRAESGYRVSGLDLDSDRFGDLVARSGGGGLPEHRIALLREALALWRGDRPYADVTEELVAAEATRLLALRSSAQELLAQRLLDRGDREAVEEASGLAEVLVSQDPLRERGHELAILAAARAGRRAEALERYGRLRTLLRDELGIDPGPTAQQLHLQVLRDELGREPTASAPARPSAPAPTTRTLGRDDELADLLALVAERRLVTIVGLGGVGKSRLLAELAAALGTDRVSAYVDLAALPEHPQEELVEAVGQALGVPMLDPDPVASLAAEIGSQEVLVLADEAERCVAEMARLVENLLARCPGLRFVVTSRRPLGVAGETVHVLGPLPTPEPQADLATVAASPAVMLLRERIADRAPALVQGDESLLRLAEFARRLDGLPLALHLLAAQSPGRTLDDLETLLDAPLSLGSDDAGLAPRHRTMQDTVGWSFDRLSEGEQRTLRRLAVFAGHFESPGARAVVGSDVDAAACLHALVRDALVHVERGSQGLTFRLLRPVRDLARERLVQAGELDGALRRQRRWHADRWRGARRSDALLLDLREHYADYVAALAGAHKVRDHEQVVDLTATLGFLWIFADLLGPGLRWCTRALDSGLLTPLERARVLRTRAVVGMHTNTGQAHQDLIQAIPVLEAHQDMSTLAAAHYSLSLERAESGDDDAALTHARLGVEAARQGHDERLADALANLAIVASVVDRDEAEAAAQESWALTSRSGSLAALIGVVTNLAWAQLYLKRPDVSLDLIERACARMRPQHVPARLRFVRGWAWLATGDPRSALAEFAHVVDTTEDGLDGRYLGTVYVGAACALAALGHEVSPMLLAGAESNWARTGTSPAAWQESLLVVAREQAAAVGAPPWAAEVASGTTLAGLVRDAAAAVASSPPGPAVSAPVS